MIETDPLQLPETAILVLDLIILKFASGLSPPKEGHLIETNVQKPFYRNSQLTVLIIHMR